MVDKLNDKNKVHNQNHVNNLYVHIKRLILLVKQAISELFNLFLSNLKVFCRCFHIRIQTSSALNIPSHDPYGMSLHTISRCYTNGTTCMSNTVSKCLSKCRLDRKF